MSKILVVDDSLLTRESLARILEKRGHTTSTAPNGRDAWLMLYTSVPDVIILDLMMPQMDGLTFLRLLRHNHHWNDVPVILLTGHSDEAGILADAKLLGVSDVIFKGDTAFDLLMSQLDELLPLRLREGAAHTAKPLTDKSI